MPLRGAEQTHANIGDFFAKARKSENRISVHCAASAAGSVCNASANCFGSKSGIDCASWNSRLSADWTGALCFNSGSVDEAVKRQHQTLGAAGLD